MSHGEGVGVRSISLDQLIALNDEMAALVRAGVPLEQGLTELGADMPGGLGDIAMFLGQRMSAGETLTQVLDEHEDKFPPVWRAVIEAGIRSGRLASALEGMSTTSRHVAEMRRVVAASLVYPLVVLALAYGLFLVVVTHVSPTMLNVYENLTSSSDSLLGFLTRLGETAVWWGIWPPVLLMVFLSWWWYRSGQAALGSRGSGRYRPGRWPTPARSLRDGRMATFAEVLSLLVQQKVPLPQAVVLAAQASGDRGLSRAAEKLAERLQSGEVVTRREDLPPEIPPLLGWQICIGAQQPGLAHSLALTADNYRQQALRSARWNAVYLPIALTVVFGGTATLLQGLVVFGPICRLLYDLS